MTSANGRGNGHGAVPVAAADQVVRFTLPGRSARGRLVKLDAVLDAILAAHAYPPLAARVLAEALTLTALFGSTLKDEDGQLTLQAQAPEGAISLLVCDWRGGALRGYLQHDAARLAALPDDADLDALFGAGYLAITFEQTASGERYQGIVPLEGADLGAAAEAYFCQSEQLPSLVRLGYADRGLAGHAAGGLLIQHLPGGEAGHERLHVREGHPDWDHVTALAGTVTPGELVDPGLAPDALLWRLFNEDEVRVLPPLGISRGCRCSAAHIREVLSSFPEDERRAMADEEGRISVDCAFCARSIVIDF